MKPTPGSIYFHFYSGITERNCKYYENLFPKYNVKKPLHLQYGLTLWYSPVYSGDTDRNCLCFRKQYGVEIASPQHDLILRIYNYS